MEEKTLTIEDVLRMLDEAEPGRGRRSYELLLTSLRQGPQADLFSQIERMAADAGTDRNQPGWARAALEAHRALDHLLTLEPGALRLELEAGDGMTDDDYLALILICNARRERGQGDAKLAALQLELTTSLQDHKTPGVCKAQENLDLAIEQLMSAYTEKVGPQRARLRTFEHLIARTCRELRQLPARPSVAG